MGLVLPLEIIVRCHPERAKCGLMILVAVPNFMAHSLINPNCARKPSNYPKVFSQFATLSHN